MQTIPITLLAALVLIAVSAIAIACAPVAPTDKAANRTKQRRHPEATETKLPNPTKPQKTSQSNNKQNPSGHLHPHQLDRP